MVPCGVWYTIVWNTCPWFFIALKVAGISAPVAARRCALSAICDLLLTLLLFWSQGSFFFFFLSSKDHIHLWGQWVLGAGGFPLWEGQRLANSSPQQLLLTAVFAAMFVLLCWVSQCHDSWFCKWWFSGPVYLRACWQLYLVFSGECFVPLSRLVHLGLYKWMFAVVWKQVLRSAFHPSRYCFSSAVSSFNIYGTVVERSLMWCKQNKVFFITVV